MEGSNLVDLQGADELHELVKELDALGVELYIARVKTVVQQELERYGALPAIGAGAHLSRCGECSGGRWWEHNCTIRRSVEK